MTNKIIEPPTPNEYSDIIKYLSTGEPYDIFSLTLESTSNEVTKKYKELNRKYLGDNLKVQNVSGQDQITIKLMIENAYSILSNQRLRQVYDTFIYNNNNNNQNGFNYGSFTNYLIHPGLSFNTLHTIANVSTILVFPLSKICSMVNSSRSIVKTSDVIKRIYKEKGLTGFINGLSGVIITLSIGSVNSVIDQIFFKYINLDKVSSPVFNILSSTILQLSKTPQFLIMDILDTAPLTLPLLSIMKSIILTSDRSSINWKNLFFGAATNIFCCYMKLNIDQFVVSLSSFCYKKNLENPKSLFWKYSNTIMGTVYLRVLVLALLTLPFDIIRFQNSRILIDHHINLNKIASPIAMNPVSVVVDLYKASGIKRFFNGFFINYSVLLCDEVIKECDGLIQYKEQQELNLNSTLEKKK